MKVLTNVDKVTTPGYVPTIQPLLSGAVASVRANGSPVLVAPSTWQTQTLPGSNPTQTINASISAGSSTVFAGGSPLLLDTSPVVPNYSTVNITGARTVEAS